MSSIETKDYLIDQKYVLGSGSYGHVCMGYHRLTGKPVAIKQLKRNISQQVLSREIEVLKGINHENIVRLICIEWNSQVHNVLVMELCTEGSLLNVLQSSRNLYGLVEEEFLILLGDVTAGVKYLRGKNFIHRDIKPGNILRSRRRNGEIIYKLTDFGSARVLEDGESFSSIYGTAEYLHPDIYTFYVSKATEHPNFDATVDLWSIGITLYQAATGEIPFKELQMLSKKPRGVISGAKADPNGEISWKEELPASCRWNPEFKAIITRLLRGLLELDPQLTMSFDCFFGEVNEILSLRKIVVFYANRLRFLGVYLKLGEGRPQLEEAISRLTSLKPNGHLLAHKCDLLDELETSSACYTKAEPLVLIGRMKETGRSSLNFSNVVSSSSATKESIANEYVNERIIEDVVIIVNGLWKTLGVLIQNVVSRRRKECQLKIDYLIKLWRTIELGLRNNGSKHTLELEQHQTKAQTFLEDSVPPTLQDKDGTSEKIKNCTDEIRATYTKLRAQRNGNRSNQRNTYLLTITEGLMRLYTECEMQMETLADHVNDWCESVGVAFGVLRALEGHVDQWNYQSEKLTGLLSDAVERNDLDKGLGRLEDLCECITNLVTFESSQIRNLKKMLELKQ